MRNVELEPSIESKENDEGKPSFFSGLFAPGSADTSGSSSDDDSAGSSTNQSTLSDSEDETDTLTQTTASKGAALERFDRELRAKHRAACKSMTVSANQNSILV